jgi:translocation and assembly module TamA
LLATLLGSITLGPSGVRAEPKAAIEGEMDRVLRAELTRAVGEARSAPESLLEARRRAKGAVGSAMALLRSEGYYEAEIEVETSTTGPPRGVLRIAPGRRFSLRESDIEWVGQQPAPADQAAARGAMDLAPGAPGRAQDVLAAEGRIVAALLRRGYADVKAEPREVIVDHADASVAPKFKIASGERVRLGAVVVESKGRTRAGWVRSMATWRQGEVFSPEVLAKMQRRLVDTGAFESVSVSVGPPAPGEGLRPVVVQIADRPRRTLELGASYATTSGTGFDAAIAQGGSSYGAYSTLQGSGVDGKWIHYNLLGRADTTTIAARLYDIQQVLDLQLAVPGVGRSDQILKAGATALNESTPAFNDSGGGFRVELERHWTKTTYGSLGARVDYVSLTEKDAVNAEDVVVGQRLNLLIPSLWAALALDRSNDPLNPSRGWRAELRTEPTWVTGDRRVTYAKVQAQVSGYWPAIAGDSTVLAGRLKLGSLIGGSIPEVPADRRFYGGGGGSVRGFAYQAVGPRLSDNSPEGGLSLAEASAEVRQRVTAKWGLVGFVDVGTVGSQTYPRFEDVSVGVGLGVRYDLGFAPFRLDIATPVNPRHGDAAIQVYVSVGQSF